MVISTLIKRTGGL